MVAWISNVYRFQFPMITDIPEPVVPYYVGTARLDEPADTRKRSWERVDSRPYPDSEESEDDVVYAEECESELQQINLKNEVMDQITVDTCGERCMHSWTISIGDEWNEKSDTPESEIDTSDSGNGVHVNASDSSSPETETMTQRLSGPPVVAQTRPKGGCQTAMHRRKRRRRNVRTADSVLQRWIQDRNPSPQVQLILRGYIKCQNVSRRGSLNWKQLLRLATEWRQPKCSDCSCTDPLPLVSGRLGPAGHDTMVGKPPAEMNICNTSDNLQIEMSVMLVKMADGSPPAEVKILTDSDTLQTELSVMTATSKRWMERFIMNPQVLCLDGLTSADDPEDRSSDVDGEDGVFQDPIPTVVSVRPEVTEKWMEPVYRKPGRVSVCFQDECGCPDVRAGRV